MNELTLTELDMGFSIPKILHASAPSVDHQGRKKLHSAYHVYRKVLWNVCYNTDWLFSCHQSSKEKKHTVTIQKIGMVIPTEVKEREN